MSLTVTIECTMSNGVKFIYYQNGDHEITTDQIYHMRDIERQLERAAEFIRKHIKKQYYLP